MTISADKPSELELNDSSAPDYGEILYSVLSTALDIVPLSEPEKSRELIRHGKLSFLFDGDGRFLAQN